MANKAPVFRAPASTLRRISTNASGEALANSFNMTFAVSADGAAVVFATTANNLVLADKDVRADIYVKILVTGAVTLVSSTVAGAPGLPGENYLASYEPSFSPDGTKVIFGSAVNGLVPGDNNDCNDIFIKTLATGEIVRVSTDSAGVSVDGYFYDPVFSPEGARILFFTTAALIAEDTNGEPDVYIKNLTTGLVTRVSTASDGAQGLPHPSGTGFGSRNALFSADGTKVLFTSQASNLVPGDTNGDIDLFVKNLVTGSITRVSTSASGGEANGESMEASFSADQSKVVFTSRASNLVSGDTNDAEDVFVKDLTTGAITRISTDDFGNQLAGASRHGSFSPDGSRIVFQTVGEPRPEEQNHNIDVYVKDLSSGLLTLVSRSPDGTLGYNGASGQPRFTPDGSGIFFVSDADGLFEPDTSGTQLYLATLGNTPRMFRENWVPVSVVDLVKVSDDTSNFGGGSLTIAITGGGRAGDLLALDIPQGGTTGLGIIGNIVRFDGMTIGTLAAAATQLTISLNVSAGPSAVEALSRAVTFTHIGENPGTARDISFTLVDGGGTLAGGSDTASFTRSIAIVSINDRPNVTGSTLTMAEGATHIFSIADFGFTDVDGNALMSVQFNNHIPVGHFYFDSDGAGGAAPVLADSREFTGAEIAQGLVSYRLGFGSIGAFDSAFAATVRDDGGTENGGNDYALTGAVFNLRISDVAQAPTVSLSSGAARFVENALDNRVQISLEATVFDPDEATPGNGGQIVAASVRISGNYRPAEDSLQLVTHEKASGAFDAATGTLTITPTGAPLDFRAWGHILTSVYFRNASDTPDTAVRTVTVTMTDGSGLSGSTTRELTVTAVNDAPIVDLNGPGDGSDIANFAYTEQMPLTALAPAATLTDLDSPSLGGGVVALYYSYDSGSVTGPDDVLGIISQGSGPGQISTIGDVVRYQGIAIGTVTGGGAGITPLIVSLNEAATPSAVQALIRAFGYANSSDTPPVSPRFVVSVTDGDGGVSAPKMISLYPLSVDDPSIIDLNGSGTGTNVSSQFVIGSQLAPIAPIAQLSDVDTTDFAGSTLRVRIMNAKADDSLGIFLGGGISVDETGQVAFAGIRIGSFVSLSGTEGTVTLGSYASLEAIEALIRAVGFTNVGSSPSTEAREIIFSLVRGGSTVSATATVSVASFANKPAIAVGDSATVAENTTVSIAVAANDIDQDGPALAVSRINGVVAAAGATITLASGATVSLEAGGIIRYNPNGAYNDLLGGQFGSDSFTYGLAGGSDAVVTVRVTGLGVNERATAVGDNAGIVSSNGTLIIDILGNDIDLDGPAPRLAWIAWIPVAPGIPIELNGGGRVIPNADGTVTYDPNGAFGWLAPGQTAIPTFRYALIGGSEATVQVTVRAPAAAQTLQGDAGANTLIGADGDDVLIGGLGADILNGADGTDTVSYADDFGAVFVNLTLGRGSGNAAADDIYISIENVLGSIFDDTIIGEAGVNRLDGRGGNDTLIGALGADVLVGGDGTDTASYGDNQGAVFVNLGLNRGYNNAAEGDTYDGIENLTGGLFDDVLLGDTGNDRLDGAMGADLLYGQGGADTFVFAYAPGATSIFGSANVDTIADFVSGTDRIELSKAAFGALNLGTLSATAFATGATATTADQRILYDAATGTLRYDADGTGVVTATIFAVLESKPAAIAAGDFFVA